MCSIGVLHGHFQHRGIILLDHHRLFPQKGGAFCHRCLDLNDPSLQQIRQLGGGKGKAVALSRNLEAVDGDFPDSTAPISASETDTGCWSAYTVPPAPPMTLRPANKAITRFMRIQIPPFYGRIIYQSYVGITAFIPYTYYILLSLFLQPHFVLNL